MMLRGSALFYALAMAVLIGLLSSSLILYAHTERLLLSKHVRMDELRRNMDSGMEWLLASPDAFAEGEFVYADLFGRGRDSVALMRKTWGAYSVFHVRSFAGNMEEEETVLAGWLPDSAKSFALYLADLDQALSLSGKTDIVGRCYLPQAGVQRAYIEGQSFEGFDLIRGLVRQSARRLEPINVDLVKRLDDLVGGKFLPTDRVEGFGGFAQGDSLYASFLDDGLVLRSLSEIVMRGGFCGGQVCFFSSTSIRVKKEMRLDGVLLVAPKIFIEDGVVGSFQAFARDSLLVGKRVEMRYPSVLGIVSSQRSPDLGYLFLDEKSTCAGLVFGASTVADFRKHVTVRLAKETHVIGQVWCFDLLDIQGIVWGDVTATKFELKTPSAYYSNHLLGATIDRTKLPFGFTYAALTASKGQTLSIMEKVR
ncbi:MAG: hypothetical protein ACRCYO_00415 [Bacteroidia bacterium]